MESRRMNMLESCWFRTQFLLHRSSTDPFKISWEKLYSVCLYFLPLKTCNFPKRTLSASNQLTPKESFAEGPRCQKFSWIFRESGANVKISCCQINKRDSSRKVWEKRLNRRQCGVGVSEGGRGSCNQVEVMQRQNNS